MNTLSIFLYLADVSGSFSAVILISAIVWAVILAGYAFVASVWHSDSMDRYTKERDPEKHKRAVMFFSKRGYLPSRWAVCIIIAMVFIGAAIPSKQTLYMIAGSKIGEGVVASDEAREIYQDIRTIIRSYAAEATGE